MILLIDNYDSFTFNIYDYLCRLGQDVMVIKNDEMSVLELEQLKFSKIILSPGPGNPNTAGISLEVVEKLSPNYPILGICLGHQIIAQHFGYQIIEAAQPMHGKTDQIYHDQQGLFKKVNNPLTVVRYHSLIVDEAAPAKNVLTVTARTQEGIIMGLRHLTLPIESVQFHPEAIKTEQGLDLLANFIKVTCQS